MTFENSMLAAIALAIASPAIAAEPFEEGMVSITLDDGNASQYTLARPALARYGYRATYYLITNALWDWSSYLTTAQAQELAADGHEIGSHTVSHPRLAQLPAEEEDRELSESQDYLVANVNVSDVQSFASPYGNWDSGTLEAIKRYYASHRTIRQYYNFRDTDPYQLGGFGVERSTTVATIQSQIDQALATKSWLILYFHDLTQGPPDEQYASSIEDFNAVLDYLAERGAKVVTVREGVSLMAGVTPAPAPTLSTVSPTSGPTAGGTSITLAGTGFLAGAVVSFGGVSVAPAALTASSITLSTPPHGTGAVDVTVVNPDGQSVTRTGAFTYYVAAPTLTTVSPTSGPTAGGTSVTLTGTAFLAGAVVDFGGVSVAPAGLTANSITLSTPPHAAGAVEVTVTNPDGRSATRTGAFTYYAAPPTIATVSPTSGPTTGGTSVTLTGTGFLSGATVAFYGDAAANVVSVSPTEIVVIAPPHGVGKVSITVRNPDGGSVVRKSAYTYRRR